MDKFNKILLPVSTLTILGCAEAKDNKPKDDRPNIIYVYPDQFRNQALAFWNEEGYAEHVGWKADPVKTPRLDEFADEAVVFSRAMSNCPLSSPYRGIFLTGMYPERNGITLNCMAERPESSLREDAICISDVLSEQGYSCGYIGKLHADHPTPNDPANPGHYVSDRRPEWDAYTPAGKRHGYTYWYSYGTFDEHKNPHYWDAEKVTVETVEYQMVPDGTTSLEMFKRGEIDDTSVESEEYLSMEGTEWEDNLIPSERSLSTNYLWLAFQSENPEWNTFINNANFRKALQYCLDREAIASLRDPVNPARVVRNTINAEGCIYDSNGKEYTDYEPLKAIKETDYNNPELARDYMEKAVAELCEADGTIKGISAGTVDYLPVGTYEVDGKLPVSIIYVGTDDEDEIIMAQLMEAMVEAALGADYVDFVPECFAGWTYGTVADPLNYDIYFDSLSTGYADPSGILSRLTTDGAENMGWYEVPEFDALIEKAEAAATFEERLQYFAEAEAWLVDGGYVIPFISSLRGYYMTNTVPYTCPLTLYGNSKFKGALVMDEPLTVEEYNTLTAAYELERAAALAE